MTHDPRHEQTAGRQHSPPAPGPLGRLRERWRRTAKHGDAGAVTAELAVATPLLLLIILFIIQAAVWMHAGHVAEAAANRAAQTAAEYQSSANAGQDAGTETLAALGSGVLKNPTVTVTRTATEVRVEVVGTAETVVPGIAWTVRAVVVRPAERFVPATGGT
jgi:Flp pilus assembly protein TadG